MVIYCTENSRTKHHRRRTRKTTEISLHSHLLSVRVFKTWFVNESPFTSPELYSDQFGCVDPNICVRTSFKRKTALGPYMIWRSFLSECLATSGIAPERLNRSRLLSMRELTCRAAKSRVVYISSEHTMAISSYRTVR